MEQDENTNNKCKVVLIGESGVGKTSILTRFSQNEFSPNNESTIGASFTSKTLTYKDYRLYKLNLLIWDTAGQETFRSVSKIFYKDASIAILVYDKTNRNSFEELINYWHKQTILHSPKEIGK